MKKYLIPFAAAFLMIATMSFTIAANKGAFNGKLKQTNNCFAAADYPNSSCSATALPASGGNLTKTPASCSYSYPDLSYDFQQLNCSGTNNPCCFTILTSTTCTAHPCYQVGTIWYKP